MVRTHATGARPLLKEYPILSLSSMRPRTALPAPILGSHRRAAWWGGLCLSALLAGCVTNSTDKVFLPQESFESVDTYFRRYEATSAQACEAARRALLSQGYLVNSMGADLVEGNKSFQPEPDAHLVMTIRVVCVADGADGKRSRAFVSAQQDRYTLKKASNSASLGVGVLGSLSVPISSGTESMIKVGSETIASDEFYWSFFSLVKRYLPTEQAKLEHAEAHPEGAASGALASSHE